MQLVLDEGKILIASFFKGKVGEETVHMPESILDTSIQLAALR